MPENKLIPILDGHNDTLLNLIEPSRGKGRSFFEESDIGHIDLPRARRGGLAGGFFAMFTPTPDAPKMPEPAEDETEDQRKRREEAIQVAFEEMALKRVDLPHAMGKTMAMARQMYEIEKQSDGAAVVVKDVESLRACLKNDVLVMIFHIEGAEAIDENLDALHVLYAAGLRSVGIVWSRPNVFGYGVPFKFPGSPDQGPGLTDAGKRLVETCNDLGIMIDVSHLNEQGFWDVVKLSKHPVVATHSCIHAICPSPRNLKDEQLDAIKDSGGIMGLNYHVGFLRPDGKRNPVTSLEVMADHLDYAVERMGIDHVALGSDFDGATMPEPLKDAAGLPKLINVLRARGYNDAGLQKIGTENWIRVLDKTWK